MLHMCLMCTVRRFEFIVNSLCSGYIGGEFTCLSTFLHFILLNLKVVTKVLIDSQNIKVSKVYHFVAQKTPRNQIKNGIKT